VWEQDNPVTEGALLSEQTGKSFPQVIEAIGDTSVTISEITAATATQASAAEEVSEAINQVVDTTHRTSAGSEEMASSSEQLGSQAGALRDLVGHFTTEASRQSQATRRLWVTINPNSRG
jgi:methyl-accepting chemotaxis protein